MPENMDMTRIFGTYMAWNVTDSTKIISFMGGTQFMYLLEGGEKALLIDTGWGAGNLRVFVEKLTDKPVLVANTHFHPDHAGGNGEWERVYVHKSWKEDAGTVAESPFDLTKLTYPDYEKLPLQDGDTIDLGGRVITAMDISAHSHSSIAFIDTAEGLIFCGDELESGQVLLYDKQNPGINDLADKLKKHRSNMSRLMECCGGFGRTGIANYFPAHNGTPVSGTYCEAFIELTTQIFSGTAVIEEKLNHPFIERDNQDGRIVRVRHRLASFFLYKDHLETVYGKGEEL